MRVINKNNLDCVVHKKWGNEVIFHNGDEYCGKLLNINAGAKFSMHFHIKKKETWYVQEGELILKYIDVRDATEYMLTLRRGDIVEIERGDPHQLSAIKKSVIFEVSTPHYNDDSYRIAKGDSQK